MKSNALQKTTCNVFSDIELECRYTDFLITYLKDESSEQHDDTVFREAVFNNRCYSSLLELLHTISFTELVDNDGNRVQDALMYRDMFCIYENIDTTCITNTNDRECSVLELFVSFAIRISREAMAIPAQDIVWMWLFNLDLLKYDDVFLIEAELNEGLVYIDKIVDIVVKFVNRSYDKYGAGGIFPVSITTLAKKNNNRDMRVVQLWDQMDLYMFENFYDYL